jgi:SPX domain protein involved in polyphosphate accumulation
MSGVLGDDSRPDTPPPFEDLKKKDFNKWYEQGKLAEWRENYIDYETLKDKIEEMYKELVDFFTEKDDKGAAMHIPKNHPKVTSMLKDFENLLINDLAKVAAFYSQEEVKVLSLTYDVMRQLKSIVVTDFSKVLNIVIQQENCSREVMDLIFFIQGNTEA